MQDLFSQTFRNLQWMIALIAPLMKEINDRIIADRTIDEALLECCSISRCEAKKIQSQKKEILTQLILNETVEILLPIAFIGAYLSVYYGTNKSKMWHIAVNENVLEFLIPVIKMAVIDSGSLIQAGITLQWFCQINILREYCTTIKNYWVYIAFWGGGCISSALKVG